MTIIPTNQRFNEAWDHLKEAKNALKQARDLDDKFIVNYAKRELLSARNHYAMAINRIEKSNYISFSGHTQYILGHKNTVENLLREIPLLKSLMISDARYDVRPQIRYMCIEACISDPLEL